MRSATISKEKARTHLKAIDEVTAEQTREHAKTQAKINNEVMPEQMTFDFADIFGDIALKEAVKHVKTITKAAVNLGASDFTVKSMLQTLALESGIVYAAVNAIEEALPE